MSARCEICGRFCPTDTHSVKLHGRKCQEADAKLREKQLQEIKNRHLGVIDADRM